MKPVKMKHQTVTIDAIEPHPLNVRQGDIGLITNSLKEHGQYRPIVVQQSTNRILAGNHTFKAAKALKWKTIEATFVECDDDQALRILLMDNRANDVANYDDHALVAMLKEMMDTELKLDGTGFDPSDLDDLIRDLEIEELKPVLNDPDDVPDDAPAITVTGDVWLLGKHRLVCGDSTNPTDLDKLMNGKQADMVWTDPPYGMSYGGGRAKGGTNNKVHNMIINDDLEGSDLINLIRDAIQLAIANTKTNCAMYACFTWRTYAQFEQALRQVGKEIKACIVWNKQSIGLGHAHYRPQHEFIFYCEGEWYGNKGQSDVWELSRGNTSAYVHPTQKPVELIIKAIDNSTRQGDIILDSFGGSGSTLIAAEQTNRIAYLMELDSKYCDVICKRYQQATGITPINEATNNPHSFI